MKSPGNFLVIDRETTQLFQILAKMHPYGNRTILKIILKFYIKLAKNARKKKQDPLDVLETVIEKHVGHEYEGFELKKIQRLNQWIEEAEGSQVPLKSDEVSEMKSLIREMKTLVRGGAVRSEDGAELFAPKDAAKLLKIETDAKPAARKNYRELRNSKAAKKIDF